MVKEYFIKYKMVIWILAPLILLVLGRLVLTDRFKSGAEQNAKPALEGLNFIYTSDPSFLAQNTLLVYLNQPQNRYSSHSNFIDVNADDIFSKENLQQMRSNPGKVVLVSDDASLTARVWMLLAQKGIQNLFVVPDENQEVFKYQFQPDTTVIVDEPELE